MSGSDVYIDTSALAKWYLNERNSEMVARFLRRRGPVAICRLTTLEMRSLLSRRTRSGELPAGLDARVFAAFEEDIGKGFLVQHPIADETFAAALRTMQMLPAVPLRSLDALHLAAASQAGATTLATADRVLASAAEELCLRVAWFG